MNILLVIPSLAIGGAEVFIVRLANNLSKNHNVYLYDMYPQSRSPLILERINKKVNVLTYEYKINLFKKYFWKFNYILAKLFPKLAPIVAKNRTIHKIKHATKCIKQIIDKHGIEIVNSHLSHADLAAFYYFHRKERYARFVISAHGCYNRIERKTVEKFINISKMDAEVFRTADSIILLTQKNAIPLQGIKLKKEPVYIPLGYDAPNTLHHICRTDFTFTFVLVSRPEERKGWEQAIEAITQINQEGTAAKLILVGGGEYQEKLKIQFAGNNNILFVGASANVTGWIALADVGIFSSYIESESFPNVIIEYLSCGKPVIATKIGEVENMIKSPISEQHAGVLLKYNPEGTSVPELKSAMYQFLKSQTFLKMKSIIANEAFEKFDMEICTNSYVDVYKKSKI